MRARLSFAFALAFVFPLQHLEKDLYDIGACQSLFQLYE